MSESRSRSRESSDPDSNVNADGLAPEGHTLKKSKTRLRFANSKLSLVNNPVQEQEDEEEERLIPDQHKKLQTPDQAGHSSEQTPLQFSKVFIQKKGAGKNGKKRVADESAEH